MSKHEPTLHSPWVTMNTYGKTSTLDPPKLLGKVQQEREQPRPRLTVLYHPNLARIGAVSEPGLFDGGEWVEVGRSEPGVLSPSASSAVVPGSLGTPSLGPLLFKARWDKGAFEVQPAGRAPLSVLKFEGPERRPLLHPVDQLSRLDPGAVLAVGDQLLIRLHMQAWEPPARERMGMVGETSLMWSLRRRLREFAPLTAPAVVFGPTGTGKELAARALHDFSERASGPLITINCAALPEHLVESLLFGHTKGAFTGADEESLGAFQDASGGTLFLDEVGTLPMEVQAKMLRVLQEGEVTPVGSHDSTPVDVRVVAATNQPLEELVEQGRMRADFYYRIAVLNLNTLSLRQRQWDIPTLFVHFLRANTHDYPSVEWLWDEGGATIPMSFFVHLLRRPWRGNVRELQNFVAQVCRHNVGATSFVSPELFTTEVLTAAPATSPAEMTRAAQAQVAKQIGLSRRTLVRILPEGFRARQQDESLESYGVYVNDLVLERLFDLLDEFAFNQVRLAERLGLSRATLIRLIKLYAIPRPSDFDDLEAVYADANGDIEAIARHFNVSPRALRLYLKHFPLNG